MYHIGICDDEKDVCKELGNIIEKIMETCNIPFTLETWYSSESLCSYLEAANHCDLLFLDIEFSELNGIDAGEYIRDKLDDSKIVLVYISYHTEYALHLFKLHPMDFLVKPLTYEEVKRVICVFLKNMERRRFFFEYQAGNEYYRQACEDILYLTSHEEKEFYGKLKDALNKLPQHFIQIHKSFIVNQDYVIQYSYDRLKMANDRILNISRPYKNLVREKMIYDKRERERDS